MNSISRLLLLSIVALLSLSFDNETSLLNKPIPLLPNKTLDGVVVDKDYYKGHITLVSFMYIGCPPCMKEINILNKIKEDYSSNKKFQMICVARQMKQQMIEFNSNNGSLFSSLRKAMGADSIKYLIQPGCDDVVSKMETNNDNVQLHSECTTIEDKFGITGYPTIFYVDQDGIVRSIHKGGPTMQNDTLFYKGIKTEIDHLLSKH